MTDWLKLVVSRFIYDLASLPKPTEDELNEEIDRLLYIQTAEQPNYLVDIKTRDNSINLDADVLSLWFDKKFRPALLMLLLDQTDNYQLSKEELCKMQRYGGTWVNLYLRPSFLRRHAFKLVREVYFANNDVSSIAHAIQDLKRSLTLISEHLSKQNNMTLLDTDRFTSADVRLYCYLKRILLGKYRDDGLSSHVRLCDPLIKFMHNYATKNSNILDISSGDPLSKDDQEPSLITDIVRTSSIGLGFILFFLYLRKE